MIAAAFKSLLRGAIEHSHIGTNSNEIIFNLNMYTFRILR